MSMHWCYSTAFGGFEGRRFSSPDLPFPFNSSFVLPPGFPLRCFPWFSLLDQPPPLRPPPDLQNFNVPMTCYPIRQHVGAHLESVSYQSYSPLVPNRSITRGGVAKKTKISSKLTKINENQLKHYQGGGGCCQGGVARNRTVDHFRWNSLLQ